MSTLKKNVHRLVSACLTLPAAFLGITFFLLVAFSPGYTAPALAQAPAQTAADDVAESLSYVFGVPLGKDIVIGYSNDGSTVHSYHMDSGVLDIDGDTVQFRIGSQTKMFTAGVILDLLEGNPNFTLDSTINDLLLNSAVNSALPDNAGERIGHYTVRELLNMTTDLPNFLAVNPPGMSNTLVDYWQAALEVNADGGYGSLDGVLDGYDSQDHIHDRLIELALDGQPMAPPNEPFQAQYSNSNAVILARIAEALTVDNFAHLLDDYLTNKIGISHTELQDAQGDSSDLLIGTTFAVEIKNLEPNLAWTSGAIITTMPDLLKALKKFYDYENNMRWLAGNSALMDLHGEAINYGLGLFVAQVVSGVAPETATLGPQMTLTSVGHAGAIPGSASFSGWLTHNGQAVNLAGRFDLGLSVYVNGSAIVTEAGYYTNSASEALFMNMADQLYRQYRSENSGALVYTTDGYKFTYKENPTLNISGGYSTTEALTIPLGKTLEFKPLSEQPLAYFINTDALSLGEVALAPMILQTLDPVFYYYGTSSPNVTALTVEGDLVLPAQARIESRANGDTSDAFTFLAINNSNQTIFGQVASYGVDIVAVSTNNAGSNLTVGDTGVIEAHGQRAVALVAESSSGVAIDGKVSAVGSAVTALSIVNTHTVTLNQGGQIRADSYAVALKENVGCPNPGESGLPGCFEPVDPKRNGAVAVKVAEGTFESDGGSIISRAAAPPAPGFQALATGIEFGNSASGVVELRNSCVVSDGYGVDITNNGGSLSVNESVISGALNSIHISNDFQSAANANIELNNATLFGAVKSEAPASTSLILSTQGDSRILSEDIYHPVIEAQDTAKIYLNLAPGTTVGYKDMDLPELGEDIVLFKGITDNSTINGIKPLLGLYDLYSLGSVVIDNGQVSVNVQGFNRDYSPNVTSIYDAYRLHTAGVHNSAKVMDLLADGDNLSPESHLDQLIIGQNYYRQVYQRVLSSSLSKLANVSTGLATPAAGEADQPFSKWIISAGLSHFIFTRDSALGYSGFQTLGNQVSLGLLHRATEHTSLHAFMSVGHAKSKYDRLSSYVNSNLLLFGAGLVYRNSIKSDLDYTLSGSFSVGQIDNDYSRTVGINSPDTFSGTFNQSFFGMDLDLTLNWRVAQSFYLRPRLNLNYLSTAQDGLSETPSANQLAALTTEGIRAETFQTYLGIGAAYEISVGATKAMVLGASVGWEHLYGDVDPVSRGYFTGSPANSFITRTSGNPKNALAVGASVELVDTTDQGFSFNLSYDGQLASGQDRHQFNLGLRYSF
ncbi:MAG: autotransporter domain-containing protein [Deltaproteobacteria bacterium]|jgi:CubicO group peptidase (beta-lactamase class C family)|nr:autotransporter domain-containing protein [Deltaproteobacteria bacterium]